MQPHDTIEPQFPDNLQEYAPWVAKYGLLAPYGECQCGCGERAPITPKSARQRGYIKSMPIRYMYGHQSRKPAIGDGPNPYGLCMCGCGQTTSIATSTSREKGWVRGKHLRYISGHFSTAGTTRPKQNLAERFWGKVDRNGPIHPALGTPCWVWTAGLTRFGYGKFQINRKSIHAHRVVWTLERGDIPGDLNVLHHCDNPPCVNPDHLYLGTHADNHADMMERDRYTFAKLTKDDVRLIRQLCASGMTKENVASRFHVHPVTVSKIVRRTRWKSVE